MHSSLAFYVRLRNCCRPPFRMSATFLGSATLLLVWVIRPVPRVPRSPSALFCNSMFIHCCALLFCIFLFASFFFESLENSSKHIFFCIIVINDYKVTLKVVIELTYVFLHIVPRLDNKWFCKFAWSFCVSLNATSSDVFTNIMCVS